MLSSRDDIRAALSRSPGVGSHHLKLIARNALIRAGCEAGADPRRVAVGLNYSILSELSLSFRAELQGQRIVFLWDPYDWVLNMAIGCAMALLTETRLPFGIEDIYRLAGHLAVPAALADDPGAGTCLPAWFVTAYRANAGRSDRSGAWPAAAR